MWMWKGWLVAERWGEEDLGREVREWVGESTTRFTKCIRAVGCNGAMRS